MAMLSRLISGGGLVERHRLSLELVFRSVVIFSLVACFRPHHHPSSRYVVGFRRSIRKDRGAFETHAHCDLVLEVLLRLRSVIQRTEYAPSLTLSFSLIVSSKALCDTHEHPSTLSLLRCTRRKPPSRDGRRRLGGDHWIASFIVCVTGGALLLAFSLTACSDPGIVYRPAERIPEPGANGGGAAAVTDTVSTPAAMEGGGVLCGKCALVEPTLAALTPLGAYVVNLLACLVGAWSRGPRVCACLLRMACKFRCGLAVYWVSPRCWTCCYPSRRCCGSAALERGPLSSLPVYLSAQRFVPHAPSTAFRSSITR